MSQALPLIWCVSEDTRAMLLGMITDLTSVPDPEWVEWQPEKIDFKPIHVSDRDREYIEAIEEVRLEVICKFMSQAPQSQKRVK